MNDIENEFYKVLKNILIKKIYKSENKFDIL